MITLQVDASSVKIDPAVVVVAGYTGRDRAAVQHHIDELAAQGIRPPPEVPMYWAMPPNLLSQDPVIQVPSGATSGEVELALVVAGDETFLAAGSDHTCRQAEAIDIRLSKLICPTPIGRDGWRWADVADRWEDLALASNIEVAGVVEPYQAARAGGNVAPQDLLAGIPWGIDDRPDCFVMLCGTVPALGGIRPADRFDASITDLVRGESLTLGYGIEPVTEVG